MSSRLEVIAGPMFAGKTEELIRRTKREQYAHRSVVVIKPYIDTRTESFIASRAVDAHGNSIIVERFEATVTHSAQEIQAACSPSVQTVVVDEAQFFGNELPYIIGTVLSARKDEDFLVIVSGLDLDYALRPFGPMPLLLAMADEVIKLDAICMRCHARGARFTQRIRGTSATVQVGDLGDYQVRCRRCHYIFTE